MIKKLDIPDFLFLEYSKKLLVSFNQNDFLKKNIIIFDEKLNFEKFKGFINRNYIDSNEFLCFLMIKLSRFFESNFEISYLINFFYHNQNFLKKEYKFFLNFGLNSINYLDSSSCFEIFEIEFLKIEFKNLIQNILKIILKIKNFFYKFKSNETNNFSFFFIEHINLLKEFLHEFFNKNSFERFLIQIENFKKNILNFFENHETYFKIYLKILKKEILNNEYRDFSYKGFEIIELNNQKFFFHSLSKDFKSLIKNLNIKNIIIFVKNFDENLYFLEKLKKIKDLNILIFNVKEDLNIKFDFNDEKKEEYNQTKKTFIKEEISVNFFDIWNLIFDQDRFVVQKIKKIKRPHIFSFQENDYIPNEFFEKIVGKSLENIFQNNNYRFQDLKGLKQKVFQIYSNEISLKMNNKSNDVIKDLMKDQLINFCELIYDLKENNHNLIFQNFESLFDKNLNLESKKILINLDNNLKKIKILDFIYSKSISKKDIINLERKIDIIFHALILSLVFKNFKIEINLYTFFNLMPQKLIEINESETRILIESFKKKILENISNIYEKSL